MKPKTDYIITTAKTENAVEIAQIEAECFSQPWSQKQIENEISNEKALFLTAVSDDRVFGYVSGQLILDEFYISNIAVASAYRTLGIGSALIKSLIKRLINTDCSLLTLEVRESNSSARHLYENFGFQNLGNRKDFYSFPREDACIYTLYLNTIEKESLN